jgi:hypothetical protein
MTSDELTQLLQGIRRRLARLYASRWNDLLEATCRELLKTHDVILRAVDPFTMQDITNRAGEFVQRYSDLYMLHRKGARYAIRPVRDYAAAVTLCQTWDSSDRLEKLAVIFLTTDHRFAEDGSRTLPQFLALASWCDGLLAEHESKRARS